MGLAPMVFRLSLAVVVAAVLFGGGTRSGFLGDVVVQLLAVPLLVIAAWKWMVSNARWHSTDFMLCLSLASLTLIFIVQLAPWPPAVLSIWESHIPNLDVAVTGTTTLKHWHGLSKTPHASWAAAVSLIPCLAVLFGVCQLDTRTRFQLACVISVLGALSLLLGFIQVLQGPGSELRFFEITNPSEAVGFFANRNHFAALLYTTLIFASVWLAFVANNFASAGSISARPIFWFALAGILVISILAGIAIARSRAGILLSAVALVGIVIIIFAGHKADHRGRKAKRHSVPGLAAAMILLAIIFTAQFGLHRVMTRFENDPLHDLRFALTPATFEIALNYMPLGSGLGSFEEVYSTHEKTENLFNGYANRAHNDWVEVFLETGILGAIAISFFLAWFVVRVVQISQLRSKAGEEHHLLLQRGAALVIPLLMAHSLVDYPLRTTAMSVIFTFSCALLITPPSVPSNLPANPQI